MMPRRYVSRFMFLLVALPILSIGALTLSPHSLAQETIAEPIAAETASGVNTEQVQQLISTLQDEQARTALIDQLELLVKAENERTGADPESIEALEVIDSVGNRAVDVLAGQVATTRDRLANIIASLSQTPDFFSWLGQQFGQDDARAAIQRAFFDLAVTFGFGALAAWAVRRVTRLIWPDRDGDEGRSIDTVVFRAIGRIVLSVLTLGVFAAASYAAIIFISDGPAVRRIAIGLVLVISIHQVVMFVIGEVVRPRYVRLTKEQCLWLAARLRRLASVSVFGYFAVTTIASVGLPENLTVMVSNLLGLVVLVLVLRVIFATSDGVSEALRKATGPLASIAHVLGRFWIWLSSLYAIALFVIWSLGVDQFAEFAIANVATVVTIGVALIVDLSLHKTVRVPLVDSSLAGDRPNSAADKSADQAQLVASSAWDRFRWPSRLFVAIAAVLLVGQYWGVDVLGWLQGARGQAIVATAMNIALICIVALVIWDILRRGIESWLTSPENANLSTHRTQRARTLLPLLRTGLGFLLGSIVLLAILGELGINIAPLLAGAGVVGLAIGFGSQALVRDVISGAFMLAENTLSVGDVVKLGEHSGVVEALTIRSVRLRDLSGTVHTIPLGEITAVENMTRDFSYYVMDVGISYNDDVDLVIETLHELGKQLQDDPTLGWDMLEPLEVLGVDQFADSAVIIKARIKTIPLRQWAVGREFNRLMKKRFDELGITIPFPQMTISYEPGKPEAGADPLSKQPEKVSPEDAAPPADATTPEPAKAG